VANLLVLIESAEGKPLPGSLEALGQARRVGSTLGATVYALAPCAEPPGYGDDDLIAILSRHGADKVLLAADEAYRRPLRFGTVGPLLQTACASLPPSLLLAAATDGARDFAPRVAARLGAAYLADAWVDVDGEGLALWAGSGAAACRLDGELEFPVVALIPPGRYAVAGGDEEAEVEVIAGAQPLADFEELGAEAARAATVIGDGEAARRLAAILDGAEGEAPLVIELRPASGEPRPWAVTVALGDGAAGCAHARYAVEGDAQAIAAQLAAALGDAFAAVTKASSDDDTLKQSSGDEGAP